MRGFPPRVNPFVLPGTAHATDVFGDRPDIAERIAVWLAEVLR